MEKALHYFLLAITWVGRAISAVVGVSCVLLSGEMLLTQEVTEAQIFGLFFISSHFLFPFFVIYGLFVFFGRIRNQYAQLLDVGLWLGAFMAVAISGGLMAMLLLL